MGGSRVAGWLRASHWSFLWQDFLALASVLDLPEASGTHAPSAIDAVFGWLAQNPGWLLVFDNVDEIASVSRYLPTSGSGLLLLTTRDDRPLAGAARTILEPLTDADVAPYVQRRLPRLTGSEVNRLAGLFAGSPLAMELGVGQLAATGESGNVYSERFAARRSFSVQSDPDPVDLAMVAGELAIEDRERRDPESFESLRLVAFVAAESIPGELLAREGALRSDGTRSQIALPGAWLAGFGLVRLDGGVVSVSPLLQASIRGRLSDADRRYATELIIGRLNAAVHFDRNDPSTWAPILAFLPHLEAAAAFASSLGVALAPAGRLLNQAGLYLESQGQLVEATAIYTRALGLAERALGPDHPTVAVVLRNLALATLYVGNQDQAKGHLQRALAISEAHGGPTTPAALTVADNLSALYLEHGQLAEAVPLLRRVLAGKREKGDRPGTGLGIQRLATALLRQGEAGEARTLLDEGLAIAREIGDQSTEANFLTQLASLDSVEANPEAALPRLVSGIALYQEVRDQIGEARGFAEIGSILASSGRFADARRILTLSHLLFASVGRPEADESYGQLLKLTAEMKEPADTILSLLQPAKEEYRKDRGAQILRGFLKVDGVQVAVNGSSNGMHPGGAEIVAPHIATIPSDAIPVSRLVQFTQPQSRTGQVEIVLQVARPPVFPLSAKNPAAGLYLDLTKRSVTNMIYGSQNERDFHAKRRTEGRDSPAPERAQTMIGLKRLDNLQACVETVLSEGIPGDLIEAGVWRGGAAIFLRSVLKAHGDRDRIVWVADSFAGYRPAELRLEANHSSDPHFATGEPAVAIDTVMDNFQKYGLLDGQVRFVKGFFNDALPSAGIGELALVHLSTATYPSTMDSLMELVPKVVPGGFVVVDHYAASGCRRAVGEFRRSQNMSDALIQVDWSGVYWRLTETYR